jgi:hypothetical protein
MCKVVFLFSVVMWAVIIAVIFSAPRDVRRTVHLLKDMRGRTPPPVSSIPRLSTSGANARPVQEAGDPADYEFAIGSAAFSTQWLRDATASVKSNRDRLAQRPVWLFSSGPFGAEAPEYKNEAEKLVINTGRAVATVAGSSASRSRRRAGRCTTSGPEPRPLTTAWRCVTCGALVPVTASSMARPRTVRHQRQTPRILL